VVIPYLTGQETATLDSPLDQIGQVGSGGQDSLIGNFFASTYVQFIVLTFIIILILSRSTSPVAIEDLSRQIRKTNTKAATQIKDDFEKTFEKTAK
ncbi:MAG: hypothetical protein IH840_07600, partial [Candidatus Heimdallarchaeota archaeon]|nr:hypothetical protein [Candidatus Heimdallarchaeota archaeon]